MDPDTGTPRHRRFVADYQAAYGAAPTRAFAALGYDAVMLVADAIKRAGTAKRTAIPAALEATRAFPAVTGAISFAPEVSAVTGAISSARGYTYPTRK